MTAAPPAAPPAASRPSPALLGAIALGGMLGASARYGVARLVPVRSGHFPWATFGTNLAGSFVLGLLLGVLLERVRPHRYLRPFAATGILGAFTTMSTYQVEVVLLVRDGHAVVALVYAVATVAAGVASAYAGVRAGRLGRP